MKHNTVVFKLVGISILLAVAGTAVASNDATTVFFKINALHTVEGSPGYFVDPNGSTIQPANPDCPSTLFYEPQAGHSAEYYDRMNKTLLAAFLAGRSVEMEINGTGETCGPNGYAAYEQVHLNAAQ